VFYEVFMHSVVPLPIKLFHGCPLYRPAVSAVSAVSAQLSGKYNENNLTGRFRLKYAYKACGAGRWPPAAGGAADELWIGRYWSSAVS
jgi:hypothetical protein